MNWRTGFDRLAWFLGGITFFVIAGVIAEDVWDDNDFALLTSVDWAVFAGSAIGGGLAVLLVLRGIGWVVSGFLTRKDDSPVTTQPPAPETAVSQQDR
jgi:hypothetical protein